MLGIARAQSGQIVGVAAGQWYRLITSAFLPGTGAGSASWTSHSTCGRCIIVGPALERTLGSGRYLAVYLASALGGSIAYFLIAPPYVQALGASGAIFGLFGAWFVLSRRLGLDSRQVVFLIVLNLAIGFAVPYIAWQAHVGGLVAGGLLTAAYAYAPRRNRTLIQVSATVVIVALLIVGLVVRDYQLAGAVQL